MGERHGGPIAIELWQAFDDGFADGYMLGYEDATNGIDPRITELPRR